MTPLDRTASVMILAASLLLAPSLAGCVGLISDETKEDEDPARLYLSAVQDEDREATATLDAASIELDGDEAPATLNLRTTELDLATLATNATATLVGVTTTTGNATNLTVSFGDLSLGDTTLTDTALTVPVEFELKPGIDVTLAIDVDATIEEGSPTLDSLVVQEDEETLETVTRSQFQEREDPPELPTPTLFTESAERSNYTGPSFLVNEDLNFTYRVANTTNASVQDAFWAFGDDNTAQGHNVTHAYRTAGFYEVTLVVEGERGQQAVTSTPIAADLHESGNDNIFAGTAGTGALEDYEDNRDVKYHALEATGNFTSLNVTVKQSPSGDACDPDSGDECAPSNLYIELYNPDGEKMAEDKSEDKKKILNVSGLLSEGEWTLRVIGDQGAAVGYSYNMEAGFFGLCQEAGGVAGYECGEPPEPIGDDDGS